MLLPPCLTLHHYLKVLSLDEVVMPQWRLDGLQRSWPWHARVAHECAAATTEQLLRFLSLSLSLYAKRKRRCRLRGSIEAGRRPNAASVKTVVHCLFLVHGRKLEEKAKINGSTIVMNVRRWLSEHQEFPEFAA